jgi:adenine phosphoribosyltransferase
VDDVVSTGSTLKGLSDLISEVGGQVAAVMAVFTEGSPREDVIALGHLPLFKP